MRVLRFTKIMWKTQVTSSILLSILVNLLCADSLQETREEHSLDRSILGGPFLNPPLVLSLGYGLIRERKPPKPKQMRGTFVIFRPDSFHRPPNTFARPTPQTWNPPGVLGNRGTPSTRMPVTYVVSQPLDFGYDAEVEFHKSEGFTLPPEVTVYHPTDYSKEYLVNEDVDKELLTGEKREANDDDEEEASEIMVDGDQYFRGNRKPLVFESRPKNIYEIINAERLSPEELDVTVEKKMSSENTVEATDLLKVKAVDGEGLGTGSDAEEVEDRKTVETRVTGPESEGCGGSGDGEEENIDLRVEKLAERKSIDKIKSRLDVVVIGQQICR